MGLTSSVHYRVQPRRDWREFHALLDDAQQQRVRARLDEELPGVSLNGPTVSSKLMIGIVTEADRSMSLAVGWGDPQRFDRAVPATMLLAAAQSRGQR